MKKLITIMAAAVTTLFAFGAVGDVSAPPAGFEGYTSGAGFDPSVTEGERTYWYAATVDDTNIITNYAESGTSVPSLPTDVVRPDGMKVNNAYPSNSNFLSLETSTPLFRSVQANNQDGTFIGSTISESGIYLDTLVKFTASEEEFKDGALEADVDKIAIEYVEHGEESLDTNDPNDTPFTNFVIRAGYIGTSAISQKNYRAYLPDDPTLENFDKDAWHRLTVRAIANIGGNNVGFIVYLDQKPLAYDGVCGDDFSPSTDAQNYYNDEIHAVYPSAIEASDIGGDQIAAVAFSGNGSIDDVVFTTEKPAFITASESVIVPFVADAGVTAISVLPDGATDAILVDMTADTLVAVLPAQTTDFTVTATIDTVGDYEFDSITVGETDYDTNPASVTGYAGGDITITTVRNNFNLFDANRDPIQGTFQKLSEALAAQNVAKIVLAHSYNVAENEGNEFVTYDIDSDITLDLNGNTITGGGDDALFTVGSGVTMIVIDSLAANTGKIDYTGTYAVFYSEGDVVIGATTDDYGPTIDGYLAAADDGGDGIWLIKGKIEAVTNSDGGAFLWGGYLGDPDGTITSDADLDSDEEYWVVTPHPTTYAISWTLTGGTTTETAGDFEENAEIVFTADTGKTLSFVSIDGTEIADTSVYGASSYTYTVGTAAATLVVTFTEPAPTTYEVTWTLTGGTTTATSGDDFEENDTIVFAADSGKTLSYLSIDGVEDSSAYGASSYTYTVGTADAVLVVTFTEPAPTTYEVTWTLTGGTTTATSGDDFEENDTIVFAADSGKTLSFVSIDGTEISDTSVYGASSYTYTVGTADAVLVVTFSGSTYPSYIPEDAAVKAKYDIWADTYGADTGSAYKDAFLLNIAPNAADQTLEPASITMEGGKVVISANQTLTAVNGKVYVKVATTLAGLASAEWTEATLNEGKVQVTPDSSDTAGFYKIKVDF